MKIRKHTYYYTYSNLIFYYMEEGIKSYAVFIKDVYNRFVITPHADYKAKAKPDSIFRLYHNFYIQCYNDVDVLAGFYLV